MNRKTSIATLLTSVIFCGIFLMGCQSGESGGGEEELVPSPPRDLNWKTAADVDFKYGETIQFEGYPSRITVSKEKEIFTTFGPRHNSTLHGGEIHIELTNHPMVTGYDSVVSTYKTTLYDSVEITNWRIFLSNGDTLTDEFLHCSKMWVSGVNTKKEEDYGEYLRFYELELDTMYALAPDFETDYKKAVPLTPELGKHKDLEDHKYTYSYIEGEFDVPGVVTAGSRSYSFAFEAREGFHDIDFMPVFLGELECGKTAELFDGFYPTSVKFWDAELTQFGCYQPVRVYGLWEEQFRSFTIEEFVVLTDDTIRALPKMKPVVHTTK